MSLSHLQSKPEAATLPARAKAWEQAAWAAGIFCILLGAGLLWGHLGAKKSDPWRSPQLLKLKEDLKRSPKDESIKQQIRALDLQFRGKYFGQLQRKETGTLMLIGGAAALVIALAQRNRRAAQPYLPGTRPLAFHSREQLRPSRWSVAAYGAVAAVGMFALSLLITNAVPRNPAELEKMLAAEKNKPADVPTAQEMGANWPCFRGYEGAGFAPTANPPTQWDATNGVGIAWKIPSPLAGFNSPIVWSNRVFFSGGGAEKREVACLDAATGKVIWQAVLANVPGTPTEPPEIPESTGYAAPTMATDGRRVYVCFANGDFGAFTLNGQLVWSKGFGSLHNAYGHANSLVTWQDKLLIQLDQGESDGGKSRVYALDGRTGRVLWEKPRQLGASWASPIVFEAGVPQFVTLSLPLAVAYHAVDGSELWRVDCLNGEVCPSPAFAGGMVLVASPSDKVVAIKPDGRGDITKTHVTWSAEENVPDVTSPASNGELVFTVSTSGMFTCLDARDGKKLWDKDYEMDFHSSPVIAGNRVYLFSQKGTAFVVEAAREYKELFRTEMPDSFHATPAIAGESLYVRGLTNVWRIGGSPQSLAQK